MLCFFFCFFWGAVAKNMLLMPFLFYHSSPENGAHIAAQKEAFVIHHNLKFTKKLIKEAFHHPSGLHNWPPHRSPLLTLKLRGSIVKMIKATFLFNNSLLERIWTDFIDTWCMLHKQHIAMFHTSVDSNCFPGVVCFHISSYLEVMNQEVLLL